MLKNREEQQEEACLKLAWERLLIAAFAAGYKMAPSVDSWGDENSGWELSNGFVTIFWLDHMAAPSMLRAPLDVPLFDVDAARQIANALGLTMDSLEKALSA